MDLFLNICGVIFLLSFIIGLVWVNSLEPFENENGKNPARKRITRIEAHELANHMQVYHMDNFNMRAVELWENDLYIQIDGDTHKVNDNFWV